MVSNGFVRRAGLFVAGLTCVSIVEQRLQGGDERLFQVLSNRVGKINRYQKTPIRSGQQEGHTES